MVVQEGKRPTMKDYTELWRVTRLESGMAHVEAVNKKYTSRPEISLPLNGAWTGGFSGPTCLGSDTADPPDDLPKSKWRVFGWSDDGPNTSITIQSDGSGRKDEAGGDVRASVDYAWSRSVPLGPGTVPDPCAPE